MTPELDTKLDQLTHQVSNLGKKIDALLVSRVEKEWYTTEEVALLVRRASWTVREWCRHRRVAAKKLPGTDKWVISKDELRRLQTEGLRPVRETVVTQKRS